MDLKQVEYLEAVCRTGSISAAAAELYVSRTVVSHSLRDLEEEFGTSLFTRTRTGVALTEAGELIRDCCRQLRASYDITRGKIDALCFEKPQPTLKIAVTTTTGARLFPEFFCGFQALCPGIRCCLSELSAYDTIEGVRNGNVDFAITPVIIPDDCRDIGHIFLHTLESVVCVSRDDPLSGEAFLTKEQIQARVFVTPTNPMPRQYPLKVTMRVNNIQLLHRIVASGMAISLLPADFTREWNDVVSIPLRDPLVSDVHIIWNKNIPHSGAFQRFLSYVEKYDMTLLEKK